MNAARLAVPILLAAFTAQAEAACLVANHDGQEVKGRLDRVTFTTEAYDLKETAFIISLAKPVCLDGEDEYDKIEKTTRVHVFSSDTKITKKLAASVGKVVDVKGTPFGEENMHHHAPIVLNVSKIVQR